MHSDSLLGFVSTKMAHSTEDIATEALHYVLRKSPSARTGMARLLERISGTVPDLLYRTQAVGENLERPDLVGIDPNGEEVFILEAKFWAGLTANQPVEYLGRLPRQRSSILLFVSPRKRFNTLWPELLRRCSQVGIPLEEADSKTGAVLMARAGAGRTMALTSWRALLEFLRQECEVEEEYPARDDLQQLLGLSARMDSEAFLPLKSEELGPMHGRRYLQFIALVVDTVQRLKNKGIASTESLSSSMAGGRYARFFSVDGFGLGLEFHPGHWAELRPTPLWLLVKSTGDGDSEWVYSPEARERLQRLDLETPSRLIRQRDKLLVPIFLPADEERETVLDSMESQVMEVIGLLRDGNLE